MEPNKLENDFKEKLDQRTIEPSAMAWDRLDAMLSVTEEKRQPKRRWMYIAASFLGFLLVGALLLKLEVNSTPSGDTDTNTTVVNAGEHGDANKTEISTKARQAPQATELITIVPVTTDAVAFEEKSSAKKAKQKVTKTADGKREDMVITKTSRQEAFIASQETETTPAQEAEALLANSLDNPQPAKKKSSIKVDASSLLSSVEGELDNNFRSEVLQRVVKNYNTVKTSVANRNFE